MVDPVTDDGARSRWGVRLGKRVTRLVDVFLTRHSRAPTTPFLDAAEFAWTPKLEAATTEIQQELAEIMKAPERIPAFHQMSPDQARISRGDNWKTYSFRVFGHRVAENCARCPATAALLEQLPGIQNAWFSILAPGYHIPPHRGPTRALVRCHLGLQVPSAAEDCWIRVGDQRRHWQTGECLFFDDTYEHEVHNNTDEARVVLFLDVERPFDRIGGLCQRLVFALIRGSAYVKRPLANLARWHQQTGAPAD